MSHDIPPDQRTSETFGPTGGGGGTLASDAERDDAVRSLSAHFAEGRLRREELDQRVDVALAARTRGQLRALFADLPAPAAAARRASPPGRTRPARPLPPPVLTLPVLILPVLVALALVAALHGVFPVPLIPLSLLLARRLRRLPRQARPWNN